MAKSIGSFTVFVMVAGLFLIPTNFLFSDTNITRPNELFLLNIEAGVSFDSTGIQNINALRIILPLVTPKEIPGLFFSTGIYLGITSALNQIGLTIPRKYNMASAILNLSYLTNKNRFEIETLLNWARYTDTSLLFFFPSLNIRGSILQTIQTKPFKIVFSLGLILGLQYQATNGLGFNPGISAGIEL